MYRFRSDVRSIDGRYNSYLSVLASCSPNGMIRDSLPFRKSTMDNSAISTNPTIDRHVIQITAVDAGHRYFITYRFARSQYKPALFNLYFPLSENLRVNQSLNLKRNNNLNHSIAINLFYSVEFKHSFKFLRYVVTQVIWLEVKNLKFERIRMQKRFYEICL